mmetsp:Transcript_11239/g.21434  ORF Transcript_11239/g.21434 Transcript_11239/m.21434 type:complete len:335 (-) Transcript_11239:11-1015(-)|eukprot:scaffold34628_cov166-Amphora_coffeaeformis.AAC.11
MKFSLVSLSFTLLASHATAFFAPLPVARPASLTITVRPMSATTTTEDEAKEAAVVDDETDLTAAGLMKRDRYIATNRFSVRRNQQAKFEKRWATRKSKLAILDGFRYFQLMRRVKLNNDDKTTVYDEGETEEKIFENYVSFTVWQKKSHFSAWRNGEAFKEAHGGTSIGSFLSTMVNSAFVLRGAPRPAFYDALYVRSQPPAVVPQTVDGWRAVEADGESTLDAESYMHMTKYYIPASQMKQFEQDYQHVAAQDPGSVVASALMRRDARAKGHGIKEMTLDEPSYVAIRVFDSKQEWLDFMEAHESVMNVDYARKPAETELYEGTLVISAEQGA